MKNPFSKKTTKAEPAGKKQDAQPEPPKPEKSQEAIALEHAVNEILHDAIERIRKDYGVAVLTVNGRWEFFDGGGICSVQHRYIRVVDADTK